MKPQDIPRAPPDAVIALHAGDAVRADLHGARAAKLARLAALGLPVPDGLVLSFDWVRALGEGGPMPAFAMPAGLLTLRSSPEFREWGGVSAVPLIGMGEAMLPRLTGQVGEAMALGLYRRFVGNFATLVHGVDPLDLDGEAVPGDAGPDELRAALRAMLARFEEEVGAPFPQSASDQLELAARAMARSWNAPSARILREARGAPALAGMGLIVQRQVLGIGAGLSGKGRIQMVDGTTGAPDCIGHFRRHGEAQSRPLTREAREQAGGDAPGLGEMNATVLSLLRAAGRAASLRLGDAFTLDFAVQDGEVAILDALPVRRNARAAVRIAVNLAEAGAITREQALLRVEPRNLIEHLHPQIDPGAARDVVGSALGASPGAASGRIVFSAQAAQAAAAQDEASILVRIETSSEDVRGMHSARGVLTMRGGMTSHAAVIARGIGLPCVVGAQDLRLDPVARTITAPDGRVLREGDVITLDGTNGEIIAGAPRTILPELNGAFSELLSWADEARELGVRANADTPAEARMARQFKADGLGLCRTEHMFFDAARLPVMREMILSDTPEERRSAIERLLEMQRADFAELFEIMRGLPVTIRLLDPPLHEFLPKGEEETAELARAMGMSVEHVRARTLELSEVNPMLGMRGVRLGIVMPEIYDMQARAIFEAAIAVNLYAHDPVVPEVMIPLISAYREVELVKRRVDAIATAVQEERGVELTYKLGVMVETPRAALRAGDLAGQVAFLSFGTNDLTQMTYGLSRDDAGRFMRDYVNAGVFAEDPFHSLDVEGVGELMLIAARRGRAKNPDLVLGLCGEHGGDPSSVRFCKVAGFDYVSCSPYRVPIARLAAAQASILARPEPGTVTDA